LKVELKKHVENGLFITEMKKLWEHYGNHSNKALESNWRLMEEVFRRHIDGAPDWDILPLPTGTGKTEGTCLYSALLGGYLDHEHPGVLIVTHQIESANNIADRINKLSAEYGLRETAFAFHSGLSHEQRRDEILCDHPVLIITHKAYQDAMEGRDHSILLGNIMDKYLDFNDGERRLIVIDEHLDIVENFRVTARGLHSSLGFISDNIRAQHPDAVEFVHNVSVEIFNLFSEEKEERIFDNFIEKFKLEKNINLGDLISALSRYWPNRGFDSEHRQNRFKEERKKCVLQLRGLQQMLDTWVYYFRTGEQGNFETAQIFLPLELLKGCVVLDATASTNKIYEVFDKAKVHCVDGRARSYSNVTIHIARGHNLGKDTLCSEPQKNKHMDSFLSEIRPLINEDVKSAVITHKEIALELRGELNNMAHVGWWGKDSTGSNQWADHGVLFFYGLLYLPKDWPVSTFMAHQGPQSDEWLHDNKYREFKGYSDIRSAIYMGKLSTDLIQAVNRIRCRNTIDSEGNCASCDVYLPLMAGCRADTILNDIESNMPGVKIVEWAPDFTFRTQARSRTCKHHRKQPVSHRAIVEALSLLEEGDKVTKKELADLADVSPVSVDRWLRHSGSAQFLARYSIDSVMESRMTNSGQFQLTRIFIKGDDSSFSEIA